MQLVTQKGPNHLYSLASFLNHKPCDMANYLDFSDQIQYLISHIWSAVLGPISIHSLALKQKTKL